MVERSGGVHKLPKGIQCSKRIEFADNVGMCKTVCPRAGLQKKEVAQQIEKNRRFGIELGRLSPVQPPADRFGRPRIQKVASASFQDTEHLVPLRLIVCWVDSQSPAQTPSCDSGEQPTFVRCARS